MGNSNHSCHTSSCFSKIALKTGISDIQQLVHTYNFHWEFLNEHQQIVQQILAKHKIENVLPIITNYLPNDNHQNKDSKIYHGCYYHKFISSPLNHGQPPCKIWLQSLHYTESKNRTNSNSDNSCSSVSSSLAFGEVIVDSDDSDDYTNDYYSRKSKKKSKKPKQKPQKKTKKKAIITKKSVKTQPKVCKTEGIKIVFVYEFYWSAADSITHYLTNLKYVALNPNEDEINLHSEILKEKKINQYEENILYLNMKTEKALVRNINNKWCDQGNFFMIYFYANNYMSCKKAMGYFGVLKAYKMNKKQTYGVIMVGLITENEDSDADGTTCMCRNKFNELLVLLQENNIAYFEVNDQINNSSLGHDLNFVFRQCVYEYWMQTGCLKMS